MKINLAENLLRFGAKGVNKETLKSYLIEQKALAFNLDQLPQELQRINYKPDPATYIAITDGNPWLAENRAISLKNFLIANIQKQIGIPFDANAVKVAETAVSPNRGDEYQYVEGTIYGYMEKPPVPEDKYQFFLRYNFYEVNGAPYILITKQGKGNLISNPTGGTERAGVDKLQSQMPNGSILFKHNMPGEIHYGILVPLPNTYVEKSQSTLYFDDLVTLTNMKDFIQQYESAPVKFTKNPDANIVLADFVTGGNGGIGNGIEGSGGSGANIEIIAKSGVATKVPEKSIVKSTYGKYGKGIDANKPGTGTEGAWAPIGSFQLSKAEGAFLDNMITLQPGSYQKVFDSIKADVQEQLAKGLQIKSLTAVVKGYASADRATNRLPQGVTAPDHTYGGHVPAQYWIRK
jgi:hypothetical protein